MIIKTRGIVLSYLKYRDTSIIVRIFTEEHGMHSFIVNNIRSTRSKKSIGLYQPFNLLDIVSYWKEAQTIHRLSDAKLIRPLHQIHQNIKKTTVTLFLSEFLQKVLIHEQAENLPVFNFIYNSILSFEELEFSIENFHIQFLLKLTPHLGFGFESVEFLNLLEENDEEMCRQLLLESYGTNVNVGHDTRNRILTMILQFYHQHIDNLSEIKSLKVLQQIFRK
jgi:DNA repair protein RecO (recombination protein O)